MAKRGSFRQLLEDRWSDNCLVCVGLDSEFIRIPNSARRRGVFGEPRPAETMVGFNESIVEATCSIAGAYKLNSAFYEEHGDYGITVLRDTISLINSIAPEVPVILDAKRADIGNTNAGYVQFAFDYLEADAITVHPYLGREALQPFLDRAEKGVIVLCRTSNPGAGEFQDLTVGRAGQLYERVAYNVFANWNLNGNCAVVVGATYPEELARVRQIVRDMPILIPGIGAQGGDVEATVLAGRDSRGKGMIINSSRGIIFASSGEDYAEAAGAAAQLLNEEINRYRLV